MIEQALAMREPSAIPWTPRRSRLCRLAVPHREAALSARHINSSASLREYAVLDFDEKGVDWCIRLSPHYYNTDEEVDQVVAAVSELATSFAFPPQPEV